MVSTEVGTMEIWKDIKGFDGFYQISNYGAVRSFNKGVMRIRKLSFTHDGYAKIRLQHNNRDITTRIHRLVANAFIDNPDNKSTVNHKDGNKLNNYVGNLEWATRHEQTQHSYDWGLKKPVHTNRKLSDDAIKYIRSHYKRYSTEYGTVALGKKFGVTNRVIGLVVRNKAYKNVN